MYLVLGEGHSGSNCVIEKGCNRSDNHGKPLVIREIARPLSGDVVRSEECCCLCLIDCIWSSCCAVAQKWLKISKGACTIYIMWLNVNVLKPVNIINTSTLRSVSGFCIMPMSCCKVWFRDILFHKIVRLLSSGAPCVQNNYDDLSI